MTTGNDKNQSPIIAHRLPEFVQTDHPTMVAFIQAYYEWLDQQADQGYVRTPAALDGLADVDKTIEEFVGAFKKEYLTGFPEEFAVNADGNSVDIRQLIKNIKEFYRNKGTEKTYEFLFRVLYDTAVEFYYPSRDILRLSDGKWIQKYSIRCSNDIGSKIFEARGKTVIQRAIDGSVVASGRVIDVSTYQIGSRRVAELFISNINGRFQSNTSELTNLGGIEFTDNSGVLQQETRVYPILSTVSISSQGTNYRKGDRIFFQPSITPYKQNLLKFSEAIANTSNWINQAATVFTSTPNSTIAPDGSSTATTLKAVGTNNIGNAFTYQYFTNQITFNIASSKTITASAYMKAVNANNNQMALWFYTVDSNGIARMSYVLFRTKVGTTPAIHYASIPNYVFNVNNPSSITHSGHLSTVTDVGNGWVRVTATITINNAPAGTDIALGLFPYGPQVDGSIYVWGAQINEGSSATPYLKTEGTAPLSVAATNDTGQGAVATIIDVDSNGGILKTRIDNFGIGYEISPLTTFDSAFGSNGAVTTTVGSICTYPGYYSNNDGRLSTNKVMQDNHYYQNFSYVLLTEVVIDRYKDILRRLIHPSGMGMFGKVSVKRCAAESFETDAVAKKTDLDIIGNYSPYMLSTYTNIADGFFNNRPTPYFPSLHDLVIAGSSGNPSNTVLQSYSKGEKKNYVTSSNDASNWRTNDEYYSTTPNYATAPDGTQTASLITKGITNASILSRPVQPNLSAPVTYSLYFKQDTFDSSLTAGFALRNDNISTTLISSNFVFANPVLNTPINGPYGNILFEQAANDWYRVNITATSGITSGDTVRLYYGDTGNIIPNGKTLLVWGMQLEPGLTANSLVKTTSNPISNKPYAVTFTPNSISGLKIWLNGKTLTAAAGATVGAWSDSSGNGFTASSSLQNQYPTVSAMGGLLLTGSSGTFGSVLTTPSLTGLNDRSLFIAFTPFPLADTDITTSQRNALVAGMMRGQGIGATTSATGQHYQGNSICVDYNRRIVDGSLSSPRIAAYYGMGNHAGIDNLFLADINEDEYSSATYTVPTAGRFARINNNSAVIYSTFTDNLSSITAGNTNTTIASSILAESDPSLTAAAYSFATEVKKFDRKSNFDQPNAKYYRYQKMAEFVATQDGSFNFSMNMKTDSLSTPWRAILTQNDQVIESTSLSQVDVPNQIAEWNSRSMSNGFAANSWSYNQYQTHTVSAKNIKKNDVICVWMSPSVQGGSKYFNNSLDTNKALYLKDFVVNKIYSKGKNFLTVNGTEVGTAIGNLNGLTSNQRLTIGLGQNYFNGVVHEVLVYNRALTKQERETVEAYLYKRWTGNIISAANHSWNLPIDSASLGIHPALPSEGGYTASAQTNMVSGYPFFQISENPNVALATVEQPYAARILGSQYGDFLGGGTGSAGYWAEWTEGLTANRHNWAASLTAAGSRHALLNYSTSSEFRKITAEAFFDQKVGLQFDCKNELIVEPTTPVVNLRYCSTFETDTVFSNGTIIFNYDIANAENLEYWITDLMEIEVSDGRKLYRYRPEAAKWNGKINISGFTSEGIGPKGYTVTFRLLNYYGKIIPNSTSSVEFSHQYASPFPNADSLLICG